MEPRWLLFVAFVLTCGGTMAAQSRPLVAPEAAAIYQRLVPQISRIKIFDQLRNTDHAAFMPNQAKLQQHFRQQAGQELYWFGVHNAAALYR
jgi:hypothetical protein